MDKKLDKVIKRLNALEDRVEELETTRTTQHGTKSKKMADWIMSQFATKNEVPISTIRIKGKKLGFSSQMLSKVKHDLLSEVLATEVGNGQRPWMWVKIK